ncbi:MAG: ATP-binding protein [Planctomycetes bacterium]|nr:ATP-binding protein [Planctomycetota bacterium]
MAVHEQFELEIPSTTEAGQALLERVAGKVESLETFSPHDAFGIRLALDEALVNAIKHGNGFHPEKTVKVICLIEDDLFRIEIEDQGPGFRLEDVPDPTDEENLERPCGRGIMLMRSFMSRIEYNSSGNKVLLEKRPGVKMK